ncbi:MAG: hypothetical protein ACODAA_06225 [Gemmatimonadota bacterium]
MTSAGPETDWSDLTGRSEEELSERLGSAVSRTMAAGELWLIHRTPHGRLRLRCSRPSPGAGWRVASWTLELRTGHETLRGATEAIGLWPAAAPDAVASALDVPLARRPLRSDRDGVVHSLTATIRDGRFTRISVFDEAPDWL